MSARVRRECCYTTFESDTTESAVALHVSYHNAAKRRGYSRDHFIGDDEQPLTKPIHTCSKGPGHPILATNEGTCPACNPTTTEEN